MIGRKLLVLSLVVVCEGLRAAGRAPPLPWRARRDVTTTQGVVRGYLGPRHYAFLGVPYARPPTLADRFKAPEPPPEWDGVFEATYRVKCPQSSGEGEENCLVVNVFVPEHAPQCCPLPVIVHVHDGGFHDGWGALHPPFRLLEDFLVVTFNYRLGTLGFLCLGTPEAPGNAGLKDQVAALYWIQQNIASFGGNPDDVTVYGTGSGATSAQLLLLSGLAKGLVHRVILESGSVLSPSSMAYDPFTTGLNIATSLGYDHNGDTDELIDFYRNLPLKDLVNISINFLPCVENGFLYAHSLIDQDPIQILKDGKFGKVPMMLIFTKSEEIQLIEENYEKFTGIPEYFEDMLPNNLEFDSDSSRYKIAELTKDFYFEEHHQDEDKIVESYKEYINDIFMDYPVYKFGILYAAKTTVPVYVMRFAPDEGNEDSDTGTYEKVSRYIFAKDLPEDKWTVANTLVSLWTNFMKLGDPTPLTTELVPVIWEPLNPHGMDSVDIDRPCLLLGATVSMGLPPSSQQLNFWDYIYSRYYRKHTYDGE